MDEPGRRLRGAFDWIVERVSARSVTAEQEGAGPRVRAGSSPAAKLVQWLPISGDLLEITDDPPVLAEAPNVAGYACLVSKGRAARRLTVLRPGARHLQGEIRSLAAAAPATFDAVAWWKPPKGAAWVRDATLLLKASGVLLTCVDENWIPLRAALARGGWDASEWFALANVSAVLAAFRRSKDDPKR